MKVDCAENCGNAPRKELLRDFTIALAKNNSNFFSEWLKDDINWEIIGEKNIQGKEAFESRIVEMNKREVEHLRIEHIITHGNKASVNGSYTYKDGKRNAFCDVYEFAGFGRKAMIKKITSYFIPDV